MNHFVLDQKSKPADLVKYYPTDEKYRDPLERACIDGNLPVFQYLLTEIGLKIDNDRAIVLKLVNHGHLVILRWFYEVYCPQHRSYEMRHGERV